MTIKIPQEVIDSLRSEFTCEVYTSDLEAAAQVIAKWMSDEKDKEIQRLRAWLADMADDRPNHGAIWGDDNAALEKCWCTSCCCQMALNGKVCAQ